MNTLKNKLKFKFPQIQEGNNTEGLVLIYTFICSTLLVKPLYRLFSIRGVEYISILLLIISFLAVRNSNLLKKVITSFTPLIWLIWVVYALINWKVSGLHFMPNSVYFIIRHFLLPIGVMWSVYFAGCINLRKTSIVILITLIVYVLTGIILQDTGTGMDNTWEGRGGADLGNALPLTSCCLAFFACFCHVRKIINGSIFSILLLLALSGVLFTSTRKALLGMMIIFIFYLFRYVDINRSVKIFQFFLFVIVAGALGYYILNYTHLGSRFSDIDDQAQRALLGYYHVPTFLSFLGDRALHYLLGWELFLQHPLTGVGLKNFIVLTNFPVVCHSEYMVQLCENGIIGFILFSIFMGALFYVTIKQYLTGSKDVALVCLGGLCCMLLIDLTAWTYEFPRYFAIYGIILAYCKPMNRKFVLKKKNESINEKSRLENGFMV